MKHIKVFLTAAIVVIAFMGAVAFKAEGEKVNAESWYAFTNSMGDGDQTNPINYTLLGGQPSCDLGNSLCAVFTQQGSNPNYPDAQDIQDISDDQPKYKN